MLLVVYFNANPNSSGHQVSQSHLCYCARKAWLCAWHEHKGNSLNLIMKQKWVFSKVEFTIIVVSIWTKQSKTGKCCEAASSLTRKLTKLAPKLIRGLWFLKHKMKGRWHVSARRAGWSGDRSIEHKSGSWVEWQKWVKPVLFTRHRIDSLWRHGQVEAVRQKQLDSI